MRQPQKGKGLKTKAVSSLFLFANLIMVLAMLFATSALGQVPATFQYFYDELGQLIAVIDSQGHTVIYEYDAVGNLLAIRRNDATGPVAITFVNPSKGVIGQQVEIAGIGFSTTAAQNQIAFNGTSATVLGATSTVLRTQVPDGALTGPITVTTPSGSAVSPQAFIVLGHITISPAQATQVVRTSFQFTATVTGTTDHRVVWKVNGQQGGSTTFGTITTEGIYTAPAAIPTGVVTVQAVSVPFPEISAEVNVTIVAIATGFAEDAVSVAFGSPPPGPGFVADAVSVAFGSPPPGPGFVADAVSVANAPVITTISPATGSRGTTFTLTLTGANFAGATALIFVFQANADSQITASNFNVDGTGTTLTASITITSSAAVGNRTVIVNTPQGKSTPVNTGTNTFSVQ